ncbi:MAG: hypothetical protein AAGA56_04690, partial [Myxococcota bacterium]
VVVEGDERPDGEGVERDANSQVDSTATDVAPESTELVLVVDGVTVPPETLSFEASVFPFIGGISRYDFSFVWVAESSELSGQVLEAQLSLVQGPDTEPAVASRTFSFPEPRPRSDALVPGAATFTQLVFFSGLAEKVVTPLRTSEAVFTIRREGDEFVGRVELDCVSDENPGTVRAEAPFRVSVPPT